MWNFNELAKKAQELQEQANLAASTFSATSGFSLNLDSMQQNESNTTTTTAARSSQQQQQQQQQEQEGAIETFSHLKSIIPLDHHWTTTTTTTPSNTNIIQSQPIKRPIPKGKLQIPKPKTSTPVSTVVVATEKQQQQQQQQHETEATTLNTSTTSSTTQTTVFSSTPKQEGMRKDLELQQGETNETNGWNDNTDLLDVDTTTTTTTTTTTNDNNKNNEAEEQALQEKNLSIQEPNSLNILVVANTDTNETTNLTTTDTITEKQVEIIETKEADASSSSTTTPLEPNKTESTHQQQEHMVENTLETNQNQPQTSTTTTISTSVQHSNTIAAKQSLLLLVSSASDTNSKIHQASMEQILRIQNISYDIIDTIDQETKMIQDELVSISKITNEFPQIFLIDVTTGMATFWGLYNRWETIKEMDSLKHVFFGEQESTNIQKDSTSSTGSEPTISSSSLDKKDNELSSNRTNLPLMVSEEVRMEQFTLQLKRLEENHQTEMADIEKRHAFEIDTLKASINHDECETTRTQLEERLMAQIREKEEKLRDLTRRNEGYQLKLDALKRELEGTQALLEGKNTEMGKSNEENLKQLRAWEKKVTAAEAQIEQAKEYGKKLELSLEESKKELAKAHEEHDNLRERMKTLATELKARRVECRQLNSTIEEIMEDKSKLTLKIENLEFQLSDRERSGSEKYKEMEKLRSDLSAATAEIEKLRKSANEKDTENERMLSEYKRKTQSALAMANARTASAVQSKEEAELEARAARSTADSAMERAVQAELKSKAAVAQAQVSVKEMESARDLAVQKHEELAAIVRENASKLEQVQNELTESRAMTKGKEVELAKVLADLTTEKSKSISYERDVTELNSRISLLRDEVQVLRNKLRQAEATDMDRQDAKKESPQQEAKFSKEAIDSSSIAILQQELREANEVISELKEALQNAMEANERNRTIEDGKELPGTDSPSHQNGNENSDSIPLFYAMEKTAELNVARNEITRLANLLSDAQAQKMEALDATEEMRRRMEDAEARLMRYEKLRTGGTRHGKNSTSTDEMDQTPNDSGAVNIEYLKNIMLRYLNATSLSERRALVPVVGAVLCLTHEEQEKAIASLEESVSIGGVGSTLFESLSGKLTSK